MDNPSDPAPGTAPTADAVLERVFAGTSGADLRAALVGRGILASRSPQMHVAEGARLGLRYAYRLIDFDELGLGADALPAARARGCSARPCRAQRHASVQAEHHRAISTSSRPTPRRSARSTRSCFAEGRAVGHNTDCWGFAESFRREMAGRATWTASCSSARAAPARRWRGRSVELGAARIAIFDLDRERASSLAQSLSAQFGEGRACRRRRISARRAASARRPRQHDAGRHGEISGHAGAGRRACGADLWVADIIYFPAETALLRAAAAAGSRTMSGRGMAVFQAVRAFELITGHAPGSRGDVQPLRSVGATAADHGRGLT